MYRLRQADRRGFENRVGLSKCIETVFEKDQSAREDALAPYAGMQHHHALGSVTPVTIQLPSLGVRAEHAGIWQGICLLSSAILKTPFSQLICVDNSENTFDDHKEECA